MSLTPHGPGFSFLDAFAVTVPGREGVGRKRLDPALPFFADHFPGRPLMPGVLLVECAAQAAGALWASLDGAPPDAPRLLAQVEQFRFLRPVLPGEEVEARVVLENGLGSLARFSIALIVDQIEVARGRLILSAAADRNAGDGLPPSQGSV